MLIIPSLFLLENIILESVLGVIMILESDKLGSHLYSK